MGGTISDDNARIVSIVPKELKAKAEFVAKCENRSLSQLISIILADYVELKYESYKKSKTKTKVDIQQILSDIDGEDLKEMFESYFSKKLADTQHIITYRDQLSNNKKGDTD